VRDSGIGIAAESIAGLFQPFAQADVSISLRGASTVATDAAQIVLMDDDLAQLRTLWEMSKGFHKNVSTNLKLAVAASLTAVAFIPTSCCRSLAASGSLSTG
jgi:cation transport ATPase